MKWLFLYYILFIISDNSFSQELQLISSKKISTPTEVSFDRAGNIYYATFNGDIIKYDPNIENETIFSPSGPSTITILEAWQGLRIFTFQRDLQQYRFVNRNLSLHEDYSFPQTLVNFAEIATSSYDNNIWLIDQVDFSLKKFDIESNTLQSRTTLDQIMDPDNYEILFMKEYQNRLFLSTKGQGILIFDNFGSYIKTYKYEGISFFNFWKDNIYFIEGNKIIQLNLYSEEIVTKELPSTSIWLFTLIYNDLIYLFSKNLLELYK